MINSMYSHPTIKNMSWIFSSNSEANASELLENIKDMFPRHRMHSNLFNVFSYFTKIVYKNKNKNKNKNKFIYNHNKQ